MKQGWEKTDPDGRAPDNAGKPWRETKKERYARTDYGQSYDRRYASGLNDLNTMVELAWIGSRLPPGLILDAGAGTGRFASALQSRDRQVTALDSSENMLAAIREKAPDMPLIRSDIYSLPSPDNTFDGAVCMHVLFHLPDWPEVLAEIARVLRPGGTVIFEMRSAEHVRLARKVLKSLDIDPAISGPADESQHTVYASSDEVRSAMAHCGLSLEKTLAYDISHAYYLKPVAGIIEKLFSGMGAVRQAAAWSELLLGPLLPKSMSYRTLFLGKKL
ncbi:MAG: class I SAM-dependent methyltransferase [Gemmatimonadota bacterium]|nr:class I SAM-dependent methyltransferase [Gemmatimonadota bacterium]